MSRNVRPVLLPLLALIASLAMVVGLGCQGSPDRVYDDEIDGEALADGSSGNVPDGGLSDGPFEKPADDASLPDANLTPAVIGGTVSGLLGSGLALQNNGKDDLVIPSSGLFKFPTSLYPGEPYAVTVRTQPSVPTQTCTVAKGTGTANGADVLDVEVGCVTATYKVGGTISGLTNAGLVLQNNGGNDITVSGGSTTFSFAVPVPSGGNYNVTLKTQPAGQTCSISGGTGTVVAGDVTSVVVNCGTNTYTVGGTVSGLAGTVVLQNNGGNDRSLTANGSFAFSTPVMSGGAYAVTVKTHPSSPTKQNCVVANGSGTVGTANVTNVSVTCTTSRFTVGGTVSGLVGTGLVLRNNGTNDTAINANGPFTFSTTIASNSPYAVTVLTEPPNQTCQVTGGSGTVGAANVTSVGVTCATITPLSETFDGVTAPALPAGWTSSVLRGNISPWRTVATGSAPSQPNAVHVANSNDDSDVVLVSPAFTVGSSTAELSFRNAYDLESRWDGGVLEISIEGGSYQDIITAGGVFISGGYTRTLNSDSSNPLRGRQAWSGSNGISNYITTVVRLPASASGKSVRLRWRVGSDGTQAEQGWRIDSVVVTN